MKVVVQRVSSASVTIDDQVHSEIGMGFLILLGIAPTDTDAAVDYLVNKISKLRVFSDEAGKMNRDLTAVNGSVLVVSQFTLFADTRHGNRPGFSNAAEPGLGEKLYRQFVTKMGATGVPVQTGEFGADMQVALVNDGPVTIIYDTKENS